MTNDHNNTDALSQSTIYRLRWVANAMEAAKRYSQEHPDEIPPVGRELVEDSD